MITPAANEYHFVSRWIVDGTCGEVADIIGDSLALSEWWPSVFDDPGAPQVTAKRTKTTKKAL